MFLVIMVAAGLAGFLFVLGVKLLIGLRARSVLVQKGYLGFTLLQAAKISSSSPVSLQELPDATELGMIPGVDATDADSIMEFFQQTEFS